MTEKEEKALERLEKLLTDKADKITLYKTGIEDVRTVVIALEKQSLINGIDYLLDDLETGTEKQSTKSLKGIINKQNKEISELKEKWNKDTHTLQNQLDLANADRVEKDKIINLMAKYFYDTDSLCVKDETEVNCNHHCVKCIKQYFKEKAREENDI